MALDGASTITVVRLVFGFIPTWGGQVTPAFISHSLGGTVPISYLTNHPNACNLFRQGPRLRREWFPRYCLAPQSPGNRLILLIDTAQWLVRYLLEAGFAVRGAVRSPAKGAHLLETFAQYGDRFELVVVPDITKVRRSRMCISLTGGRTL
jgi:hypothetical protein